MSAKGRLMLSNKIAANARSINSCIIDKEGKIIFIQEGYGKDVDEKLDDIIKKNLQII